MKGRFALSGAAWMLAGCGIVGVPTVATDDFPPPVIAGVTRFPQEVPDIPLLDNSVPPPVVYGVTEFPDTVVDSGVPDSSVDKHVVWARFGVTAETGQHEVARAAAGPQGKGS